jgi:hypothetical protein
MNISREKAIELKEVLEDTLEYFCDENMVSGELAWTMVEALAEAKLTYIKEM